MDGILIINKPHGKTSYSMVAMVKRLSGERRVGHAGTLDPAATGVLPVCLGQGTRITEYLMDATKTYQAQIELGIATDTYDATGKITRQIDPSDINREKVESALTFFRGDIQQVPPMYSAVKYHGQPLYKLARSGINIARKSRPATVYRLEITGWQSPVFTVEVECSKGTYIRALANDLGQLLGCGAHLKSLIRLKCGIFGIEDAVSVSKLEEAFRYGYWQHFVYPIDSVLSHWGARVVDTTTENIIKNGSSVSFVNGDKSEDDHPTKSELPPQSPNESYCRAYTLDGYFISVLRFNAESMRWQPDKVFHKSSRS
ncbi:tRNA pseudouridine(55) synthase TruB [Chloroflexota bacterium]